MEREYSVSTPEVEVLQISSLPTIDELSAADGARRRSKLLGQLATIEQEISSLREKADMLSQKITDKVYRDTYPSLTKEQLAQIYEWGERRKREVISALDGLNLAEGVSHTIPRQIYHDLDMAGGYTEFQELTIQRQGTTYYISLSESYKEEVIDRYNEKPRWYDYVIDTNSGMAYTGDTKGKFHPNSLKSTEWRNVHYNILQICRAFVANAAIERVLSLLGNPDDPEVHVNHNHDLHFYKRIFTLRDNEVLELTALYLDEEDKRTLDNVRILLSYTEKVTLECRISATSLEVFLRPRQGTPTSYEATKGVFELLTTINDRIEP